MLQVLLFSRCALGYNNGAPYLRPELCPVNKYGYDARCRGWYDTGMKQVTEGNGNPLYITPPYLFSGGQTGCSATMSLVDPLNGNFVGQSLIDFNPDKIVKALKKENTPIGSGDDR